MSQLTLHMKPVMISLLVLLSFYATAQPFRVQGRLLDSAGKQPVNLATVRLLNEEGAVLRSVISDSAGRYQVTAPGAGRYHLLFSHAAFATLQSAGFLVSDTGTLFIPDYFLQAQAKELGEVVVTSLRTLITPKADGYVYNVRDDIPVAGEMAGDVLRRLPGVLVSADGAPSVNGSGQVLLFIDGKPSGLFAPTVAEALRLLPADNIEKIEVISHPSSKYEAEGVSAVINITTRQPSQNAFMGTITATYAGRARNISSNFVWKRNKWIIRLDAAHNDLTINVDVRTTRHGKGALYGNDLYQHRYSLVNRNNESAGITATFEVDSLANWNLGYRATWYHDGLTHNYEYRTESAGLTDSFTRILNNPLRRWLHTVNAGYQKKSRDKSADFSLLAAGFYRPLRDRYLLTQQEEGIETYREQNRNQSSIKEMIVQADYSRIMRSQQKLEAGARYNYRQLTSENRFDIYDLFTGSYSKDSRRSATFRQLSSISAAYINYQFDIHSWQLRLGMRYEYTYMKLIGNDTGIVIPRYGNWLPGVLISRSYGRAHSWTFSYSKRMQRPYTVYLSPVVNYMDSLNIEYGNPNLEPIGIHNFRLGYTYTRDRIIINPVLFTDHSVNNIEYVRTLRPDGITESTWYNISGNTSFGMSFNFSYQGRKFSFRSTNTLHSVYFNTDGTFPSKRSFLFAGGGAFSWKLNKGYALTGNAYFNIGSVSLQGYASGTQWYNLVFSRNFEKACINVSARLDNFLAPYQYITERIETEIFQQQTRTRNVYRFIRLSVSWRVGKKEIRTPVQRTLSPE